MDKFSTVSHSIISGLTMPSCSHKCGLATKIFHFFVGVPVIMNHRVHHTTSALRRRNAGTCKTRLAPTFFAIESSPWWLYTMLAMWQPHRFRLNTRSTKYLSFTDGMRTAKVTSKQVVAVMVATSYIAARNVRCRHVLSFNILWGHAKRL